MGAVDINPIVNNIELQPKFGSSCGITFAGYWQLALCSNTWA
jgi:hypothetical protein